MEPAPVPPEPPAAPFAIEDLRTLAGPLVAALLVLSRLVPLCREVGIAVM